MTVEFINDIDVELVAHMGDDLTVCNAARCSTVGFNDLKFGDNDKNRGLINYLMKHRHGTPFEHGSMMFRVKAPLFVWREHHRHRIGFSYNEESARYRQLEPHFYLPSMARIQIGKPGHYTIEATPDPGLNVAMVNGIVEASTNAYETYLTLLDTGLARELARVVLPVNIMSSCYVTCNPRSMMNFLALRTADNAQEEIRMLAAKYEQAFAKYWPWTYAAWRANEKVAP